jgi:hypothetical protein
MSKYKCKNCVWEGDKVVYPLDTCPVCGDWTEPNNPNEIRVPVIVPVKKPAKIEPVKKGGKK